MDNSTESDRPFVNALWTSTGVTGCLLNLALFIVVLVNSTKGFYRYLTLAIACCDFICALSGAIMATWYYKVGNGIYCAGFGISMDFPDWADTTVWIAWVVAFYGELIIIMYSFVWRAVLISNSRKVYLFEHKSVFILLVLLSCAIGYCDYSLDCEKEYTNLTPVEVLQIVLPATLSGLNFFVIAICALFINHRIKRGSFSKKTKNTHAKTLFVLSMQAVNPFILNFLVDLIYELALIGVPLPDFLISFIPFSSLHPSLNALIILVMTSDHRKFILKIFIPNLSSTVCVSFLPNQSVFAGDSQLSERDEIADATYS